LYDWRRQFYNWAKGEHAMSKKRHQIEKQQHDRKIARQVEKKANTRKAIMLGVLALALIGILWLALANWPAEEPAETTAAETNAVDIKQYDAPPPMTIDTGKSYSATVTLDKGGEFVIKLFPDKAPITVNNFVFLAREGYYNGVTFHRVLEGFMAQTGDPTGSGSGGPGYRFEDEQNDLAFDKAGVVAMANSGPNTNGSQFFITYAPTEWLNGLHTIFGQVEKGIEVVEGLTLRDPSLEPPFQGDVIQSITITEE
jgi:cyclophilin family peptidyl-prolyl cis-trans isomerase